jgi:hypothetical protein
MKTVKLLASVAVIWAFAGQTQADIVLRLQASVPRLCSVSEVESLGSTTLAGGDTISRYSVRVGCNVPDYSLMVTSSPEAEIISAVATGNAQASATGSTRVSVSVNRPGFHSVVVELSSPAESVASLNFAVG